MFTVLPFPMEADLKFDQNMSGKSAANYDDLMFTSIDSEDFLVNEEKPPLSSSWSSDSEKDNQWKSSDSSMSQLQSPPKQSDLLACSTPVKVESSRNDTKFLTCREAPPDTNNSRSLSGVNISKILETAQDEPIVFPSTSNLRAKRSLSLHDLDNFFEFPSNKLAKNADSCRMSHSLASSKTRSKDSGIHRTASCVSLLSNNTYNRKYDHVQSKVKQYIQSMKELGCKNRQSKSASKPCALNYSESRISSEPAELTEEKFNELKNEVLEKDILISTYHEKYTSLQIKYANLKRQYDALRFGSPLYNESLSPDQLDHLAEDLIKPKFHNMSLDSRTFQSCNVSQVASPSHSQSPQRDIGNLAPRNESFQSCNLSGTVSSLNTKLLKPISKLHSTSMNLSRHYVPLQPDPLKNSTSRLPFTTDSFSKSDPSSQIASLEPSGYRGDDPFLKVQRWQESLSPSKVDTGGASGSSPNSDHNEERSKLRRTKPRRRTRKSKHGGEVPDVLQNLTNENRTTFDKLREADTCQRLLPIQAESIFKPANDLSNAPRSGPKPDMLPFASSSIKKNFSMKKYYASKSSVSQVIDSISKQKSSQPVPIRSKSNSHDTSTSLEKSSKSALCCCLEASDLYINQLNEGLDKLMVALTELGTSTVLKS